MCINLLRQIHLLSSQFCQAEILLASCYIISKKLIDLTKTTTKPTKFFNYSLTNSSNKNFNRCHINTNIYFSFDKHKYNKKFENNLNKVMNCIREFACLLYQKRLN